MKRGRSQGPFLSADLGSFLKRYGSAGNHSNLTMYADDHQMYKTRPNLVMVKDSLEEQGKQAMS